ncbi:hypothetical protein HG531_007602 [Fusarium graminearum]|nr:hypothetical protein HG531_007602 [Fusarium graminearum]
MPILFVQQLWIRALVCRLKVYQDSFPVRPDEEVVFGLSGPRTTDFLNQETDDSPVLVDVCLGGEVGYLPRELGKLCQDGLLEAGMRHAKDGLADAVKLFELKVIYHGVVPNIPDAWKTAPPGLTEERFSCMAVFPDTALVPVSWGKDGELREEDGFICAVFWGDKTAVQSDVSYVSAINEEAIFALFVCFCVCKDSE